ncbi:hypothetical protein BJ508DRAFT_357933 [Ascobolus immersus RN42]|uniref:Uncharacterized protein n=1 Tax=Ascobolus immersus RN42 TaxID=1160509 RepID=A0A3N4IYY0_ASCIM|nr:hypothetical protein BJ508DRAFT_357933 [Ascobolus immersus RN42]
MKAFGFQYLFLSAATLTGVFANTPLWEDSFKNDIFSVVKASAPLWVFNSADPCLPTAAILNKDMNQPNPGGQKQCTTKHPALGNEKQSQINEINPRFPTYYYARKCDYGGGDVQYRILYNMYIPRDTYHDHDWEYAVVVWKKQSNGQFIRDSIFLEQHGNRKYLKWGDITHTVWDWNNRNARNQRNANHPKLQIQSSGHVLSEDVLPASRNCPVGAHESECMMMNPIARSGAWAANWLTNGVNNLPDRNWGSADSSPHSFQPGRHRDICWNM